MNEIEMLKNNTKYLFYILKSKKINKEKETSETDKSMSENVA